MKKIKLFVTGPMLGATSKSGCTHCHYDFNWLLTHPSSLIYSDKIIFTSNCNDYLENDKLPDYGKKIGEAIKTVFEIAKEFNLVEVKDYDSIITPEIEKNIFQEIDEEREVLAKQYPNNIRLGKTEQVPGQIFIDNNEYCEEVLWSINASLILSKQWQAETLFSQHSYHYLKYKFQASFKKDQKNIAQFQKLKAFDNFFNIILPEQMIFPYYALDDLIGNKVQFHCGTCKKTERCQKEYLDKVDETTREYLELRETGEIQHVKGILEDITNKLEDCSLGFTDKDIIREFRKQEVRVNRDLKVAFPRIKDWTNLSLIASAYAGFYGTQTGLPLAVLASYTASSIALASVVAKLGVEHYENKYRWIGFIQQKRKERAGKYCEK